MVLYQYVLFYGAEGGLQVINNQNIFSIIVCNFTINTNM
jgi:hypothetical protein